MNSGTLWTEYLFSGTLSHPLLKHLYIMINSSDPQTRWVMTLGKIKISLSIHPPIHPSNHNDINQNKIGGVLTIFNLFLSLAKWETK